MPAFEAEVGMPYWITLTTSDAEASAAFCSEVLGWEFEDNIARLEGLPIAELVPETGGDTWATYFLSRDINADCQRVEQLGGKVLALGDDHLALLVDPAGAIFGLIQPKLDQFVAGGEPGTPVWHELAVTRDFTRALDFYGELFNWEIRGDEAYALAEEQGAAFAGMWNAQGQFPEQVPSFWQTYLGVRDIDAAAQKVRAAGGEIIREPHDSPFGRLCIVADSTGATVTFCEVEDAPEEPMDELFDV
ncbi:VOC family protein [Corynebacterium sp.]|uniref:VOC family protein n=1 Tax=Corynebacterium sp. TaxID=1720 RepID=UPI0026DBDB41|nr:VOC family protein [Corynebacterium sp.]MDO5032587.1 VOC family protein [Corynebacterium sp.]